MAMGDVYRTSDTVPVHRTVGLDPEAPVYQRGRQIMTVSTFIREINDLRIATANSKKSAGLMLPYVRLEKNTIAQLKMKIRQLKRKSASRICDSSSSEDDSDYEDAHVDQSSQKEEEGNSSTKAAEYLTADNRPPMKPAERRPSSGIASEPVIWDNYSSESDLPDLTEDADPSYSDRFLKVRKEKSRGRPSENKKRKKKREKHSVTGGQGSGSGELMKAARKDCMKKMKIYSATPEKDKRVLKESSDSNANSQPLREQTFDNASVTTTPSLGRMTGLVQLKPNAKSPKDVERESDKMPLQNKELTKPIDNGVTPLQSTNSEQERVREVLRNRLYDLAKKTLSNNSQNNCSEEVDDMSRNDSEETMSGNESEETITYDADNKEQNDEILSEIPGPSKRKSVFVSEANKKLRIEAESTMESVIENESGEGLIRIQNVTGGVHEAFSPPPPPPEQVDETDISEEQPNISANLEILKTELETKEKRRGVISEYIKLIQKELADWAKQLKGLDDSIENIKKQIKDAEKSPAPPNINKEPISSVNEESPLLSSRDDASKGIGVISDASIVNFGMTNPTTKANSKPAMLNAVPSAPENVSKPPMKISVGMRKHPNLKPAPAPPAAVMSVKTSIEGNGSDKIVGANSQVQFMSSNQGQVSLQQSPVIVQKGPPQIYSKAVQGQASLSQTIGDLQKLAPSQSYTEAVQGHVLGVQNTPFQRQPSLSLRPQVPVQMGAHLSQVQQLQLQPGSQHPTFLQPFPTQTLNVVQQQQQSHLQTPAVIQQWLEPQSNLRTPSQLQQMQKQSNPQKPSQLQQMQRQSNCQTPSQLQQIQKQSNPKAPFQLQQIQKQSNPQTPFQLQQMQKQSNPKAPSQLQQMQKQSNPQTPSQLQQMQKKSNPKAPSQLQQMQKQSNPQTPSQLQQMHQQSNLQTPSQLQQMWLPFNQPHSQAQTLPQLNTPGMLRPSLNPSSQIVFLQQPQSEQGIILFPDSAGPSGILLTSAPSATSAAHSSSTTTSSITGVIPSTLQGPGNGMILQKGDKALPNILRQTDTYRPGPKSKTQRSLLPERDVAPIQNPQTSQLSYSSTPLAVSSHRGISVFPPENNSGAVKTNAPPQMAKPAAKSHLMVVAQPSVKGGVTAQAKLQPALPIVNITDHNELATSAPSHGEIEDYTSSPEAENSCFLCGSPDTFVCCNNIVYCSKECKEKDWSRHKSECTNTNKS